jgi:hypothetical protein
MSIWKFSQSWATRDAVSTDLRVATPRAALRAAVTVVVGMAAAGAMAPVAGRVTAVEDPKAVAAVGVAPAGDVAGAVVLAALAGSSATATCASWC